VAKYRITSPDGASFEITAPDDATPDQVQAFAQQQFAQMKPGPVGDAKAGGVAGGIKQGLRDPIDAGAQMLRRVVPDAVGEAVDNFGNWLASKGLPVAPSSGVAGVDKLVKDSGQQYEADRKAAGRDGVDFARLTGNVANPTNVLIPGGASLAAARTLPQLARAGAMMGAAGAALQPVVGDTENFWTEKGKQAAGGAVAGALLTPALARGAEAVARPISAAMQRSAAQQRTVTTDTVNNAVERMIQAQGMRIDDVPPVILDSVRRQMGDALRTGAKLDGAAAVRAAQAEALGLKGDAALTAGQLTRDPIRYAQERNLSGIVINTPNGPGNPLSARFAEQNRRLGEVFDTAGASSAVDRNQAGQTILDALRRSDAPVKAGVDEAYGAARAMNSGRAAPLERGTFTATANHALEQGQWGRFLPAEVRGLLNDVAQGKTPFDVDAAVQIDGILSAAQRSAGKGSPQASAIGVVRDALRNTPFQATEFADGGAGQMARQAFDEARKAAAQRFATIEQTPALKAALENEAPDNFVRSYILGADARDLKAMRKVLEGSPEALGQARAQIANVLKKAAFGENMAGDKTFAAERYAKTLQSIGPERLKVFFSPDEMVRFNIAGKLAAEINSVPAGATNAVNYSNTGSALFNLLQRISDVPGLRQVPGVRALANQAGEIANERAIGAALQPAQAAAAPAAELSPEARRALQRLFAPAAVAGGVTFGSGF